MTRILVIADDAAVRKTVAQLLGDAGYEVLSAEDGVSGLAMFRREQPDLVITDLIMPEQEGIETIAEMRAAKPDARIVAISGGGRIGNTDFLKMARALGAMDVVPKPFDSEELLMVVHRCLAGPGRASRSSGAE